jgi:hypothetical protein
MNKLGKDGKPIRAEDECLRIVIILKCYCYVILVRNISLISTI